ncbi:HAD-IIA family hydrolase [Arcanobacterium hippocoleae]
MKTLVENFAGLFLDLDGVCYLGDAPAPNAPEGLEKARKLGVKQAFITNNSGRTPEVVAEHLTRIGIPASPDTVVNSAMSTADQMLAYLQPGTRVLCVGGEGLRKALSDVGFEIVTSADAAPSAAVQGLSQDVGWQELSEVCLAVKAGAKYFATNIDATIPKERGEMLGNGSLVAAVKNAAGVTPISSGKPDRYIYEYAAKHTGLKQVLAVGDRLNTDIAGAVNARIPSLHVLTGVNSARDVVLAPESERPTYLGIDMLDLSKPYPEVALDHDGTARVGNAQAAVKTVVYFLMGQRLARISL